jgi:hypothetical protein
VAKNQPKCRRAQLTVKLSHFVGGGHPEPPETADEPTAVRVAREQTPEAARGRTRSTGERGDACPNLRIGDTCVDLFVEPVNRLNGIALRATRTEPNARLASVHRWDERAEIPAVADSQDDARVAPGLVAKGVPALSLRVSSTRVRYSSRTNRILQLARHDRSRQRRRIRRCVFAHAQQRL